MLTDMGNMVMLQVFVAGFVSKMMERIIAEQRVAAEHQRQIRDLQYEDSHTPHTWSESACVACWHGHKGCCMVV